jgi:adenylate kinase family enzyme
MVVPQLILIRGIPGSGKSTLAKQFSSHLHYEADMYFENRPWERELLHSAHQWCQEKTLTAIKMGYKVVVSNTFIKKWEMDFYLNLNVPTSIVLALGEFTTVHDVPPETIERMKQGFEF